MPKKEKESKSKGQKESYKKPVVSKRGNLRLITQLS